MYRAETKDLERGTIPSLSIQDWRLLPAQAFFQLPCEQIKALRWRLPKDFAGLGITTAQLEAAYLEKGSGQSLQDDSAPIPSDALVEWTQKLVVQTLQRLHAQDPVTSPYPGLSKASKGRCVERRAILTPVAAPCRQARHNDYQPPGEAATKHKVRQARRLRSLLKLVSKYAHDHAKQMQGSGKLP